MTKETKEEVKLTLAPATKEQGEALTAFLEENKLNIQAVVSYEPVKSGGFLTVGKVALSQVVEVEEEVKEEKKDEPAK